MNLIRGYDDTVENRYRFFLFFGDFIFGHKRIKVSNQFRYATEPSRKKLLQRYDDAGIWF